MMLIPDFFEGDTFFQSFRENSIMKTDIKEKDGKYILEVDLPGYEKENISLKLKDGYLEISAEIKREENSTSKEKIIHKERYYGECTRNFYVGDDIKEEDIKAEFKNGILKITLPKFDEKEELPEEKYIQID